MNGDTCPGCPVVPVVSKHLATAVLARKAKLTKERCSVRAFQWLTERHEGLEMYAGICGRPYTSEEKNAIALDTGAVSGLSCPLFEPDGCVLGGLGPHYNRAEEMGKQPYGWLPTLIAATYDPVGFRELVKRGAVADAKTALLTRNEGFIYKDEHGKVLVG